MNELNTRSAQVATAARVDDYGPAEGDVFLSLSIPTYNRAGKLARLLKHLAAYLPDSGFAPIVEVFISNNASTDDTASVVRAFAEGVASTCRVRVCTQASNVGMMRNFQYLYEEARGRYVCLWGDDDMLYEEDFGRLIRDLQTAAPEVCISSFDNYKFSGDAVRLLPGEDTRLVTRLDEAVPLILTLGKISQYVYRRRQFTPEEKAISDHARLNTEFWFISLSVLLFVRYEQTVLLRAASCGWSDRESHDLRFSPRAYGTIKHAALIGLADDALRAKFDRTLPEPPVDVIAVGVMFRHSIGWITLEREIADDEWRHLLSNLGRMFIRSWRNTVKIPFILAFYPVRRFFDLRRSRP